MEPNPSWSAAGREDVVEALGREDLAFKVWGGDWCKDCRRQLPDFGAALEAAGVPEKRIEHYPVEKADDGSKTGPRVGEFGVELIPTVVVERATGEDADGEELARFVEEEPLPIADYLARELTELEA
jgi:thiol-disulfide isomerase/thioredoxin